MSNEIKKSEMESEKFNPATDIVEDEAGFYLYMDMPGVTKENLEIDLNGNSLAVSGKTAIAGKREKYIKQEFCEGEYLRKFTIADVVDRESIKANFKEGVLKLFLPKMGESCPRKIKIAYG